MFHLRAFVSERLSAAAVDIFGEVEKSLSLYQVEVSRSREEIILLRQQLELLRDNNTGPLQATGGTMLDHAYFPPVLQENSQGPPGTPEVPVDEEEESQDYSVGREFLPGPSEKTEHDVRTSCTMTQPNPEIPQIKEEQDQFSIVVEVCPSPDVVKSEQDDQDGAEMEFTYRSLTSHDGDEDWVMGNERQRLCSENQTFDKLNVSKGLSDGNEQAGVTTSPCEEDSMSKTSCHFCGKSFLYMGALLKHIKTHHNMESNCGVCGKTCASTDELQSHLNDAHIYKCSVCGRTFSMPRLLLAHAKTHTGVRQHACNICGKAFSKKDHLVSHARTHSGEKPYACDICGKAYSQSQNLTIHRRSHTGEKPYQCLACDKLFSSSGQLKTHMRYHTDEKPYSCDVCGKQFRQSGPMTRHKRIIHGGERLYGCTVCGLRYKYARSLKAHLKTHEKTSPRIADL